jgi:enoyl-CoA hydratase/carnithine racemase
MTYDTLIYNNENYVAIVKLNRPKRLNAISYQLVMDLLDVLDKIDEDEEARVVILTGEGKGFCAGLDIKELANPDAKPVPLGKRYTFFNRLEDITKPVIAAINGPCNGGGLELALCCDFLIASETATLGLGEVKLGVIPAGGATARLPRLIGPARAKELLYFGNRIDGQEAYRIGLVNKVVPPEELMDEAKKWANELAERAPLSLRALKYCVNVGMQMDLFGALEYETKSVVPLAATEDCMEGLQAFIEKRKPLFKGR